MKIQDDKGQRESQRRLFCIAKHMNGTRHCARILDLSQRECMVWNGTLCNIRQVNRITEQRARRAIFLISHTQMFHLLKAFVLAEGVDFWPRHWNHVRLFELAKARNLLYYAAMNPEAVVCEKLMTLFLSVFDLLWLVWFTGQMSLSMVMLLCEDAARQAWSGPDFPRLYPRVQRETSWTSVHPSQLDLATLYVVQLEFSSQYAFGRMPACHVDDGKPYLHKSPSDSSKTCPSIHEF